MSRALVAAAALTIMAGGPAVFISNAVASPLEDAVQTAIGVGRVVGAATACKEIPRAGVKAVVDQFQESLRQFSTTKQTAQAVQEGYDQGFALGQKSIGGGPTDCFIARRDLAAWDPHRMWQLVAATAAPASGQPATARSATIPSATTPSAATSSASASPASPSPASPSPASPSPASPSPASPTPASAPPGARPSTTAVQTPGQVATPSAGTHAVATATTSAPTPAPAAGPPVRGVTGDEIRFGMAAPLSGPSKDLGRQLKTGIEVAFEAVNEAGGIHGRKLKLIARDDGYEPTRTVDVMKQLYEQDKVFGFVGNFGTSTAAVALPYALSNQALFYGAFTGAPLLRRDPPDRFVFNFRASDSEETGAAVNYLVKVRHLRLDQIAVFAQQDGFGDAGFDGVTKAARALTSSGDPGSILRLNYPRNTVDVDGAVSQLLGYNRQRGGSPIKAVVMVAQYRAAARFIDKTHELIPGLIYTNVSAVGSTSLAEELKVLGPKFSEGVIVTQVVPPIDGFSSVVLKYKAALEKYFPGDAKDYVSFEGYLQANVLIEGIRRAGPNLNTDKLVDALEGIRDFDPGVGSLVKFGSMDHQALHKVWGTQLDATGQYQPIDLE